MYIEKKKWLYQAWTTKVDEVFKNYLSHLRFLTWPFSETVSMSIGYPGCEEQEIYLIKINMKLNKRSGFLQT